MLGSSAARIEKTKSSESCTSAMRPLLANARVFMVDTDGPFQGKPTPSPLAVTVSRWNVSELCRDAGCSGAWTAGHDLLHRKQCRVGSHRSNQAELDFLDVFRLRSLGPLFCLELDPVPFGQ